MAKLDIYKLRNYPCDIKGWDLTRYQTRFRLEITKEEYEHLVSVLSKGNDVLTDGERYFTIVQSGVEDEAIYALLGLDLPGQSKLYSKF